MRTGAAQGHVGNFHEAGFYSSDDEFLALMLPFINDALDAGEPVLIGYDPRKSALLRARLPRSADVDFAVDTSVYASPAGAIEAYRRQFDRYLVDDVAQVRIAGEIPHPGTGGSFHGWDRYESAVNTVWQHYPVWSRCLYDAVTIPADVRDVVERTHPRLAMPDGHGIPNQRYQHNDAFRGLAVDADPLETSRPAANLVGASAEEIRNAVAAHAHSRINTSALEDMLFAVTEAVTNAEMYGAPPTTVTVWTAPRRVVVRVHDTGAGPTDRLVGLVAAENGNHAAGLGLWLTHQLSSVEITMSRNRSGFAVRLRSGSPPEQPPVSGERVAPGAGTECGVPAGRGAVHAIDGDGSSFCDLIPATDLVPLARLLWPGIRRDQRCTQCQGALTAYGLGDR